MPILAHAFSTYPQYSHVSSKSNDRQRKTLLKSKMSDNKASWLAIQFLSTWTSFDLPQMCIIWVKIQHYWNCERWYPANAFKLRAKHYSRIYDSCFFTFGLVKCYWEIMATLISFSCLKMQQEQTYLAYLRKTKIEFPLAFTWMLITFLYHFYRIMLISAFRYALWSI